MIDALQHLMDAVDWIASDRGISRREAADIVIDILTVGEPIRRVGVSQRP